MIKLAHAHGSLQRHEQCARLELLDAPATPPPAQGFSVHLGRDPSSTEREGMKIYAALSPPALVEPIFAGASQGPGAPYL
jgi:hypothetical protein